MGIWGFACSKYKSTSFRPSSLSGNGAGLIVGFGWRPKNESRIDVLDPDVPVALLVQTEPGLLGFTPPFSEIDPETELFTAANTTLAKDIPDVEPKCRGSEALDAERDSTK